MSVPEVYITSAIHQNGSGGYSPAVIRAQLTQFFEFKVRVPRRGYRTAELRVNLLSPELTPLYAGIGFQAYMNFLYVKWRGKVVFWGPISIKEIDMEESSLTLRAVDQAARLEHHYFRIGDDAMGVNGDSTKGRIPINASGLHLCLKAGEVPEAIAGRTYIPLGIQMGADHHTAGDAPPMDIERGQEVWRIMQDLGDRTDGPLFDLRPLDISNGQYFSKMDVYGQFRGDISSTVKFHYGIGLNNTRNMRIVEGGEILSHVHTVTQNNHWRTTTVSTRSGEKYGIWVQWEQVDFNIDDSQTEAAVNKGLGAVGDAILDAYGRPFATVEITLRRDDQLQDNTNQFYWLTDFDVSDIVEVQGKKGGEFWSDKYQIEEVRLEQESDNTGQVRQAIDVTPWVVTGQYTYRHFTDFVEDAVDDA